MKLRNALFVIAAATLTLGVALAQDDRGQRRDRGQGRDGGGRQGGGRDGERRGGGGGGRGAGRLLRFDANGDTLIEEAELRAGLTKLQEDAAKALELVMKGMDDGDGKLSETESKGLQEAIDTLSEVRRADRNRNWQLEDDEMSRLWERSSEMCQQHNATVLERFDVDKDGKLNEQEAAAAKEAMQEGPGGRGGGQRGERGGGRGGDREERGGDNRRKNDDRR